MKKYTPTKINQIAVAKLHMTKGKIRRKMITWVMKTSRKNKSRKSQLKSHPNDMTSPILINRSKIN